MVVIKQHTFAQITHGNQSIVRFGGKQPHVSLYIYHNLSNGVLNGDPYVYIQGKNPVHLPGFIP